MFDMALPIKSLEKVLTLVLENKHVSSLLPLQRFGACIKKPSQLLKKSFHMCIRSPVQVIPK